MRGVQGCVKITICVKFLTFFTSVEADIYCFEVKELIFEGLKKLDVSFFFFFFFFYVRAYLGINSMKLKQMA